MAALNSIWRNVYGAILASRITSLFLISLTQCFTALFLLDKSFTTLIELKFLGLLASTVMVAAAGYMINDYYDQKIDMVNRPQKVVVGIWLKRRWAIAFHWFLSTSAIIIGFAIDVPIGIYHILSVNILWFYSAGLRKRLLINNISIGILSAGLSLIVAEYFNTYSLKVLVYSSFSFLSVFLLEIVKDILDLKGEAKHGCVTIPVKWGIPVAKNFIFGIVAFISGLMLLFLSSFISLISILALLFLIPTTLFFMYKVRQADTQQSYRELKSYSYLLITLGIISMFFL